MAVVADIVINMQADVARMQSDLEKVTKSFDKMKKSLDIIKTASLVQLGQVALRTGQQIFRAAEEVYNFSRAIASMGNDIQRSANIAGMGIEQFQKWSYVAKMADVDAQSLSIGMKMLSRNMSEASQGSGKAAEAFKAMGIDVKSSTGGLKSLDDIMREMAGKFSEWQDGPEKIALSLAVFGRAGEALIPMLNLGKTGIQEFEDRLIKMGGIIREDVIRSLSKSEDAFKDWEVAVKNMKMSLAPLVEMIANLTVKLSNLIIKIVDFGLAWKKSLESLNSEQVKNLYNITGVQLQSAEDLAEIQRKSGWTAKGVPANLPKAPELQEIVKGGRGGTFQDPLEAYREQSEKYKSMVDKVVAERLRDQEDLQKEIQRITEEGQQENYKTWEAQLNNTMELLHAKWNQQRSEYERHEQEMEDIAKQAADSRMDLFLADMKESESYWNTKYETEGKQYKAKYEAEEKAMKDRMQIYTSLISRFSNIWSDAFTNMAAGTKKFKDVFIDSVNAMGKAFVQMVNEMIVKWIAMQAITGLGMAATGGGAGAATGGAGAAGGGGFLSFLNAFGTQKGGIFKGPQLRMIGEAGPEAVVPLKSGAIPVQTTGGGLGSTYVFISSPDAEGVQRLFQRNSNALITVIQDNLENRGQLVDSIRGVV